MSSRWVVLRERSRLRWGGDLRRHYILSALAAQPDARDVDGWGAPAVRAEAARVRLPWLRRPSLATAAMLSPDAIDAIGGRLRPVAVDIHDDPIAQNRLLGAQPDPGWLARETERKARNVATFGRLIVPSVRLAEIAGLPLDRIVVAENGTDPSIIRATPLPDAPVVGFISGAGAGRGIETLVDAARIAREEIADLRLILWLAATGDASEAYLASQKGATAGEPWIEFASATYDALSDELARATVQVVPNPPDPYWDAVSPIKLFDAMASGRPLVVTPRTDMAATVRTDGAGLVAEADGPEALASALVTVLADRALARSLGEAARRAAEERHDWRTISAALARRLMDGG
jgi:glycosyltransferase involved in cell wall biosynthesis